MAKPRTRIHSRREGWSCFGRVDLPIGHPPRQPIRLLATCLHFTHPCRHSPSPDSIPLLPLSSDDPHQDRVKTPRAATLQGLSTSTSQTSKAPSKRNFFTVFLSFFPMFFSHSVDATCIITDPRVINIVRWLLSSFNHTMSRPLSRLPTLTVPLYCLLTSL